MTRNTVFNRLPGSDRTTSRSELAVFTSLGLAGAMMVALGVMDASRFVAGSDHVAAVLSGRQESLANAEMVKAARPLATNLANPPAQRANAPAAGPGKV